MTDRKNVSDLKKVRPCIPALGRRLIRTLGPVGARDGRG